jgi:hypothetical protein
LKQIIESNQYVLWDIILKLSIVSEYGFRILSGGCIFFNFIVLYSGFALKKHSHLRNMTGEKWLFQKISHLRNRFVTQWIFKVIAAGSLSCSD